MVFAKGILHAAKSGLFDDDEDFVALQRLTGDDDRQRRREKWTYKRIDWEADLQKLRYTKGFEARYRMTEESFNTLVDILRADVTLDAKQSMRSTSGNGPITPEMVVGIGLRFLAGEKNISLADIFGTSYTTIDRLIERFIDAVFIEIMTRKTEPRREGKKSSPSEIPKGIPHIGKLPLSRVTMKLHNGM